MAANSRDEVLKFVLETQGQEGLDALTKGLADAGKQGGESGAELTKLANDLAALLDRAKQVEALQALQDKLSGIDNKLAEARAQLAKFNAENDTSSVEFQAASKAVAALTDQHDRLAVRVSSAAAALNAAGIDTTNLSKAHEELGAKATATAGHLATAAAAAERGAISFATLKEHALGVGEYLKSGGERALEFGKHLLEISGIAGIVAGAFAALKGFRFFEAGIEDAQALGGALKKLSAISGATGEDLHHLKEIAEEAAHATSTSTVESVQALTQLTKSFGDVHKAAEVLPTALQFAKAAGIELSQSIEIVATTMKAFNVNADQASHVTDALATISRKTGADLGALSDSFGKLAPYASQAHISFDQTAAALGALTQRGLSAEQSSRALIAIFGALDDPSSKLKQSLVGLGITTNDFGKILDGLKAAGSRGVEALEGMDKRAKPALLSLIQAGGTGLRELSAAIEQSTGETKRLSDFMTSGFGAAVKNFKTHIDEIAGETVSGVFAPLNAEIRKLDSELLEASKNGALEKIKESITDLVKVGAEQFDKFIHTVDWASFGKTIAEWASSARESIRTVTEGASAMGRVFGGIGDVVGGVWNVIKVVFTSIESATSTVMSGITQSIGNSMRLLGIFSESAKQKSEEWYALAAQYSENAKKQWAEGDAAADQAVKSLGNLIGRISDAGDASKEAAPKHEEHAKALQNSAEQSEHAAAATEKVWQATQEAADKVQASANTMRASLDEAVTALGVLEHAGITTGPAVEALRIQIQSLSFKLNGVHDPATNAAKSLEQMIAEARKAPLSFKDMQTAATSSGFVLQNDLAEAARKSQQRFAAFVAAMDGSKGKLSDAQQAFLDFATKSLAASQNMNEGEKARVVALLQSYAATLQLTGSLEGLVAASNKSSIAATEAAHKQSAGAKLAAEGAKYQQQQMAEGERRTESFTQAIDQLKDSNVSLADKAKALGQAQASAANDTEKMEAAAEGANLRMEAGTNIAAQLANTMQAVRQEFAQTSDEAAHFFDEAVAGALGAQGIMRQIGSAARDTMSDLEHLRILAEGDVVGITKYLYAVAKAQQETRDAIKEQKDTLNGQIATYDRMGVVATDTLGKIFHDTRSATGQLAALNSQLRISDDSASLLGQQDLAQLNAALDGAKQRLQAMAAAEQQALDGLRSLDASLKDELDRAAGNDTAIEDRRYQAQLDQIKKLHDEAGKMSDAEYQQALADAQKLHDLKMRQIQEQAAAAKKAASSSSSTSSSSSSSTSSGSSASSSASTNAISSTSGAIGGVLRLDITVNGNAAGSVDPNDPKAQAAVMQIVMNALTQSRRSAGGPL